MANIGKQQSIFNDYEGFVEKFKPKKTTDDCYTPPAVYDAVKDWAVAKYGLDGREVVRPFYPGGDYQYAEYPEGCVVIDNPPFSILAEIMGFYLAQGIDFFLFAPMLTCMSASNITTKVNHIFIAADIVYENGAEVRTAFVTNMGDNVAESAPDLSEAVRAAQKTEDAALPKYEYPDHVLTAAKVEKLARDGVRFEVKRCEAAHIRALDAQRAAGKAIFGYGLMLSDGAAERLREANEQAALNRARRAGTDPAGGGQDSLEPLRPRAQDRGHDQQAGGEGDGGCLG